MTDLTAPDASFADFDAVRERYRVERERRAPGRDDRRYRDVADGFAHLLADPYAAPSQRSAVNDDVDVLMVGGGFGGLLTAARLRQAGVTRVRIVEAGGDVGGTWYWNRYPGAACDVESYIYFPLLEETGYTPVECYSKAAEIRAIRAQMDSIVEDPATAEALKPWFSLFCKRPCFHDDYLAAFNRDNVTLVDTAGRGVERITPRGAVVGGEEHPPDCLIFATGFETATDVSSRSGFVMHGVDGLSLTQKWAAGLSTLHGLHTRGFPNAFVLTQAQAGMSPNFPHMLSEQAPHVAHIVEYCLSHAVASVDACAEAEQAWVDTIVSMGEGRIRQLQACTPGYYNGEGRITAEAARNLPFGAGPVAFINLLRAWREQGDFAGLELTP